MREALANQGLFPVGLTVADSSGNIGYLRVGRTPRRDDAIDWTRPVSGNERATQWRGGIHPLDELVQVINPPQGYVRETNLPPASMWNGKNAFLPPAFPRYILGHAREIDELASPIARGRRADDILRRAFHLTDEQAQSYAFDERWPNVPRWQRALLDAAETNVAYGRTLTDPERVFLERVLRFDGNACAESIDALAFHYWQDGMSDAGLEAQVDRIALARRIRNREPLEPLDQKLLLEGVRRATRLMSSLEQWGSKYGDVFRFGRGGETYPLGGCTTPFEASLHTTECGGQGTNVRLAVAGQKQVMLTVFGDLLRSYSLAAFGQQWRNRPTDPHFNDQSRLRSEHRLKPTLFERTQLLKHLESQLTLIRPAFQ